MKRLNRIFKVVIALTALIALIMVTNQAQAATTQVAGSRLDTSRVIRVADGDAESMNIGGIINAAEGWIKQGEENVPDGMSAEDFALSFGVVGQILVAVGAATLLIVGGIMAIKWITATPDKAAKLKQQLIGLVVATVVIFGALGIWNLVRKMGENVEVKLTASTTYIAQNTVDTTTQN